VVIVLDDAYPMGWRSPEATVRAGKEAAAGRDAASGTRFAWERARAIELIQRGLLPGDMVSVVLAAEPARALIRRPTFNLKEAAAQVARAPLTDRRSDLAGAARLCLEILRASRAPTREVYLLADTQEVAWRRPGVVEAWRQIAGQSRLHLVTPPVAGPNLAVEAPRVEDPAPLGRPTSVVARVWNHGDRPANGVVVTLHADHQAVASTRTDLPAHGSAELRFEHVFTTPGAHTLMAALPGDGLPVDDRSYAGVVARERTRVLVVNGHPDPDPRGDAAFFLTAALAPESAGGAGASGSPFQVRVLEGGSFRGTDLSQWDAVVLADVPRLPDAERRALAGFVAGGGGLLLLPGPSAQPAFYNGDLLARVPALLPTRLGPVREAGAAAPPLDLERVDHPALNRFRHAADVDLTTARFARFFELAAPDPASGARVVCRFAGGTVAGRQPPEDRGRPGPANSRVVPAAGAPPLTAPALAEREVGLGRVLLLASPPLPGWNTLPFKPAFLPFLHALIGYLGQGPGGRRNLSVGDPLVWVLPTGAGSGRREAGGSWLLEGPDGGRSVLRPAPAGSGLEERRVVRVAAVSRAGFYRLTAVGGARADGSATNPAVAREAWYAANLDTTESDLRPLSRARLESALRPAALRWVDPRESLAEVVREGRHGREAWRTLLLAALALMLCESGLAQLFGRRRGDG
jgi:hypothetical protein